ncbi:hypothetical protein [Actinoplanes aureus]|uniref:Adenylyl-sulfate kinase n=1 Tax=Actinoplanes aureus TaxID=2792083 RepID=A0A931CBX8_9ACTN|nr:hypothetical protein [Actinoplanes aureus]MBG0564531.1 hypothetical protein [Actinoplanes aureus]
MAGLPVLWLYGTSGAGKTTVAWELFTRLAGEGTAVGYVDIDQLGMCYGPPTPEHWAPEPAGDHGRHRLQARTLNAVLAGFRDAGARGVIVPGVTDPERGVETGLVPNGVVTSCRLDVGEAELARRLRARNSPHDDVAQAVAHAETLDRAVPRAVCVDTTGLSVAEVADRVSARTGWTPAGIPVTVPSPGRPAPPGEILWISGPAAIGKSTVGWLVYHQLRQAGTHAAFVDLDQIGFHRPARAADPGNHRLKAANLAAVWREFRASGAECLVAVGPLERPEGLEAYATALPATTITLCRLTASRAVLAERVTRRGHGLKPANGMAGDELIGQPAARLAEVVDRSARILDRLTGVGDLDVDTDRRPPEEIATEIRRKWISATARGWGTLAR